MKAYKTYAAGGTCIVFAETAGKARSATVKAANDASYNIKFYDVTVKRSYENDAATHAFGVPIKPHICYRPDAFEWEKS